MVNFVHQREPTVPSASAAVPETIPEASSRTPETQVDPPSRFEVAAARAKARYSAEEWVLLDPGKRSTAIYAELRRIDGSFSR